MKIISGKFKGTKLFLPLDKNTRPLRSIVKEAIFNLLKHSNKFSTEFEEKNILDLFSGTGSFGLECLSRGANHVTFVEESKEAIKILNQNIKKIKLEKNVLIINQSVDKFLNKNFIEKYNIIFLDPPFKKENIKEIIENINRLNVLGKDLLVIIHRHKKTKDLFPKNFKVLQEKKYGLSKIIFGLFV